MSKKYKWTDQDLNPFRAEPKFENIEQEISWLKEIIEVCCKYPSQSMQLLGACMINRLNKLEANNNF